MPDTATSGNERTTNGAIWGVVSVQIWYSPTVYMAKYTQLSYSRADLTYLFCDEYVRCPAVATAGHRVPGPTFVRLSAARGSRRAPCPRRGARPDSARRPSCA